MPRGVYKRKNAKKKPRGSHGPYAKKTCSLCGGAFGANALGRHMKACRVKHGENGEVTERERHAAFVRDMLGMAEAIRSRAMMELDNLLS